MTPELKQALTKRFPHFDGARCAFLFADDQEDGGLFEVDGQGKFPAIRMANGSTWFYDTGRRPRRLNRDGRDVGPMKTRAPFGERRLLCDDPAAEELTFVEGEGHAVALLSVGLTSVVACGGVNVFQSRTGWATEELTRLARGKRVRLIFDFDAAGVRATREVITRLLEVGATRVAALPAQEDWEEGWDVEDWLASFDTADAGYWELTRRLALLPWTDEADRARGDAAEAALPEESVEVARLRVGEHPVLAMVSELDGEFGLLVWAPSGLLREGRLGESADEHESVMHDAESDHSPGAYRMDFVASFVHAGVRYVPADISPDEIRNDWIVPPPLPAEERLRLRDDLASFDRHAFELVEAFIRRWVVLPDERLYTVLAAWVLVSYVREDHPVMDLAFVRFSGDSGGGKTRGSHTLRLLCFLAKVVGPSEHNLHLIADANAERTIFADEQQWRSGRMRDFLDALVKGTSRYNVESRKQERGGLKDLRCFMQSCTAGYAQVFPHPAAERRIITVPMRKGLLDKANPDHRRMLYGALVPKEMRDEAREVRQMLLAWRLARFECPLADLGMAEEEELLEAGGTDLREAFRPIYTVTPPERRAESLLPYLQSRVTAVHEAREFDDKGSVLSAVGAAIERFQEHDSRTDELRLVADAEHGVVYLLRPLTEQIEHDLDLGQGGVKRMLARALGLPPKALAVRRRVPGLPHPQRLIAIDLERDRAAFAEANVDLLSVEELRRVEPQEAAI